ncbi:MAG: LacI family DNA-binding transcriptional regulator [Trebonia sp.]
MTDPKPRVTLNDVAAASGVSRATASFVLRDSPGQSFSAATRERVREAARTLGYAPNGLARALREGTSRIVLLTIDSALDGNYARSYIRGLDAELAAHEHVLLVRYSHPDAQEAAERLVLDTIVPRAVLRFGEPYLTGRELDDSGGGWRDGLAAHVAAQVGYLAARGHTRIALALPSLDTPLRSVRQRFADQAAAALGLPPLLSFTMPAAGAVGDDGVGGDGVGGDTVGQSAPGSPGSKAPATFQTSAAYSLTAILATGGGVTAVAAFDDDVALRVLAAMRSLGLSAPGDLAVIGYDDNGYGALTTPTLTTVHIDAEAHGRQAARAVLGLPAAGLSLLPGQVVVRQSA